MLQMTVRVIKVAKKGKPSRVGIFRISVQILFERGVGAWTFYGAFK